MVPLVIPPITAMAIGACSWLPWPRPSERGTRPRIVVSVVIRIGRKRAVAPSMMASFKGRPWMLRSWLIKSTMIIPLLTKIPTRTTPPIIAGMLSPFPVIFRAITDPERARGRLLMMMNGCRKDSN